MAEFRHKDRLEIISVTLYVLKEMYKNIRSMSYDDKCKFVSILVQYLFALYADLGKRDGEWVKIVLRNILCKYSGRDSMILFLQDLVDTRNEISHAWCIQNTVNMVDKLFLRKELYTLCEELGLSTSSSLLDASKLMSGE